MIDISIRLIKSILPKIGLKTYERLKIRHGNESSMLVDLVLITNDVLLKYKHLLKTESVYKMNSLLILHAQKTNFNFFIITMFPKVKLNWHHEEWRLMVQNYANKSLILASRGIGKTFYIVELYHVWLAFRYTPDSSVKELTFHNAEIFSLNQSMANRKLEAIKKHIKENPILAEMLIPEGRDRKWAGERIICKTGFDINTFGFDSGSRGGHYFYVTLDDILDEAALYSKDYRDKCWSNLMAKIMPQFNAGGKFIIIGTPLHLDDPYGRLKAKLGTENFNWTYREYPAIFPDGRLCWALQHSAQYLMEMRVVEGELIFAQEYLCKPISDNSSLFPWRILNRCKNENISYVNALDQFKYFNEPELFIASGSDFARSASASADKTSHIVSASTKNHCYIMYLMNALGLDFSEQLSILRNIEINFVPEIMAVEDNGFQQLYIDKYKEEYVYSAVEGFTTGTNKNDYRVGLPSLCIMFEQGVFQFPYQTDADKKKTDEILGQFNTIAFTDQGLKSTSGHDDMVFCTWKMKQGIDFKHFKFAAQIFNI